MRSSAFKGSQTSTRAVIGHGSDRYIRVKFLGNLEVIPKIVVEWVGYGPITLSPQLELSRA